MLPRSSSVCPCAGSVDKPDQLVRPLWRAQGRSAGVRTAPAMAVLRGKGMGLEIALGGRDFQDALAELQGKLAERPGFYTGASAVAALGATSLTQDQLDALSAVLNEHGIGLEVLTGGLDLEPLALANGLRFLLQIDDGGEELAR